MTQSQLQELWMETDKKISESYKKLRFDYKYGSMKKKEYDLHKNFIDGFYEGWRDLFTKLQKESE